jgi:ribosomal-protein-alanine N-acetyltransferase
MPGPVFLDGERVRLRTIEEGDIEFMQEVNNDPRVWRPWGRPTPKNREQEREGFEGGISDDDWVNLLVTTDPETPVGMVAFHAIDLEQQWGELSYWIAPAHQNEGLGTEAVGLLVEYGFRDRGFHRIQARVVDSNEPSWRLLESLGFAREGTIRENAFVDGEYRDTYLYGLLRSEWEGLDDGGEH